jgi:hypothetical protein
LRRGLLAALARVKDPGAAEIDFLLDLLSSQSGGPETKSDHGEQGNTAFHASSLARVCSRHPLISRNPISLIGKIRRRAELVTSFRPSRITETPPVFEMIRNEGKSARIPGTDRRVTYIGIDTMRPNQERPRWTEYPMQALQGS